MAGRAIGCADRAPLPSQALAAPCGNFHLTQLLAGGTDTGPSLPVTLPVGPGGCGGGGDPPPPPPDGIHWVTRWRHLDHLGSLRLMTDESGWVVSGSQIDYYPFGMPMDAAPPSSWLFTGHEKDAATGLDYMLARMHSASVGSFTSVDPARGSAKQVRPDSWNRYSYVRNNPMGLTDPSGMLPGQPSASGQRYVTRPANNGALDMILTMEKDIQSFDGRDGQEDQSEEQTQHDEQQKKAKQADPVVAMDGTTKRSAGQKPKRARGSNQTQPGQQQRGATSAQNGSRQTGREVYAVHDGVVFRAGWQDPSDHGKGLGWRVSIRDSTGYDQYGHMDPKSTPTPGTLVKRGDYIGQYAAPTNGSSTGPHVHLERRDLQGAIVDPGTASPLRNGRITAPYGAIDRAHSTPHQGVDWVAK